MTTADILTVLGRRELGPDRAPTRELENWRLTIDGTGVAWLLFDRAGESANTLSEECLHELDEMLQYLDEQPPRALVIRSAKLTGFIAGADVRAFRGITSEASVIERMRYAHTVVDRLAHARYPTIAVIHGFCLGGGLEIALACRHRIAVDGATFGFPEVRLGLHPGLGGTVRLTRLINPVDAMTLMLTGSAAHTAKASRLGIVDAVTQERHVAAAVADAIAGKLGSGSSDLIGAALTTTPARAIAAYRMEAGVAARAPKHQYPAPWALIDLWRTHGDDPGAMQEAEIASFARLMVGATAQNLIRVFFLRETLANLGKADDSRVRHVHVIGAGAMGGDIAGWCAAKGCRVTLTDVAIDPIAAAMKRTAQLCAQLHMTSMETRDALDRLIPDRAGVGVAQADIVVEAAPERLTLKREIYAGVEPRMKAGAILATNTSSIALSDLTAELEDPTRFIGLHFFNPVARMEVVEVIHSTSTSSTIQARARAFVRQIDKLPAPIASAPGFLVNRALMPYLLEALVMVEEGIAKETVDQAATDFGMPMGPVELADRVGLDVCLDVADMLSNSLDTQMAELPHWFRQRVEDGHLGTKTGQGLYRWKNGTAQKSSGAPVATDEMRDRLIMPLLNACAACLRRGIVADSDVLDGAIVFGTGFAPFRGGPLHYAKARGVSDVVHTLERLAANHGRRFDPDPHWRSVT
jgi:3-hydroxyacyl-CoA dehydrogenase/enoyl-CoA hydratase/3-hydroxybutyryl-CoA epimerase